MTENLPATPGGLVERAKAILMRPKEEWPRIASEPTGPMEVLRGYAIPLAAIGPVAALIGGQVFGYEALGISYRPTLMSGITTAVATYVLSLVSLFVVAFIANFVSTKFGGRDSWPAAFKLVAFAMTASWVGGVFGLIPSIAVIGVLFSLYSIYLLYLGAGPMLGVPQDKAFGFTAVTIIAAIVLNIVIAAIIAAATGTAGMAAAMAGGEVTAGEFGTISSDGENGTIDLGELGKVEIDGDTATVTVDGQEMEVNIRETE
jgi:hypothetical protein